MSVNALFVYCFLDVSFLTFVCVKMRLLTFQFEKKFQE